MIRPALLLALAVTAAALPAAASAAPHAPVTSRQAGFQIGWPARGANVTLAPSARVRVVVAPVQGRRAPPRGARVTIALTRAGDGRTLARRTLRRGTFTARLPRVAGARYVLRASARGRVLRRLTIVVRPAPAPAPARSATPPAAPAPEAGPQPFNCSAVPPQLRDAAISGDSSALTAGQTLSLTVTNRGATCLGSGADFSIERYVGGAWRGAGPVMAFPAYALTLYPGATQSMAYTVPNASELQPGRYRFSKTLTPSGPTYVLAMDQAVRVTWEFTVLPAGPLPAPGRCGGPDGDASATVELARSTIAPDEPLELTVTNSGPVCLTGDDARVVVSRVYDEGVSHQIAVGGPKTPYGTVGYAPGESRRFTIDGLTLTGPLVSTPLEPGRYLVSYPLWVPPADATGVVGLAAEAQFDVVAEG